MRHILAVACLLALSAPSFAEEGEGLQLDAVSDPAAKQECSACHIAYPAAFLPARSWEAIMGNLSSHFGEDASLAPDVAAGIQTYLVANAAPDNSRLLRRVKPEETPLRISELPWFKRKHSDEVSPARLKKAGSWANCVACHRDAASGYFSED